MPLEYKGSLSRYRKYLQTVKNQPLVRASIWVIFSLVLTIVMIVTALKPTLSTIASLLGQIEQQKDISRQLDEKIRTVQSASRSLMTVREQVPLMETALPGDPEWKVVASRIEKEATDSGLTVVSLIVKDIPVKGKLNIKKKDNNGKEAPDQLPNGVEKMDIEFSATGDYEEIKHFLTNLEGLRRLIVVTQANISKNDKGVVTLSLSGYAIYSNIKDGEL